VKWLDINDIAIELSERYPDVDPMEVRFTDLYQWILKLPEFDDDPSHCGERILEAVQAAWLDELD